VDRRRRKTAHRGRLTQSQIGEKEKARIDPSRRNLPHSPPGFRASEAGHFDWPPRLIHNGVSPRGGLVLRLILAFCKGGLKRPPLPIFMAARVE
jgi:hypothetical protein